MLLEECRIRESFACGIRNPGLCKSGIQLKESIIQVPLTKNPESSTWNPEATTWNPEYKTRSDHHGPGQNSVHMRKLISL